MPKGKKPWRSPRLDRFASLEDAETKAILTGASADQVARLTRLAAQRSKGDTE